MALFLGHSFGICPPVASLGLWASKPPLPEREQTRTNLVLVGSRHSMWAGHLLPMLIGPEARRQRPESEAKIEIICQEVHFRGNAEIGARL